MGRRRRDRNGADDDDASGCSSAVSGSAGGSLGHDSTSASASASFAAGGTSLDEILDLATSKSASSRLSALTSVFTMLRVRYCPAAVLDRVETVLSAGVRAVRNGKSHAEREAGARVIEATIVTVWESLNCASTYQSLARSLIPLCERTAPSAARPHALMALAFTTLIACDDDDIMECVLTALAAPLHDKQVPTTSIACAALKGLASVLSVAHPREFRAACDRVWDPVLEMLDSSELQVRIAAGELLALLVERDAAFRGGGGIHEGELRARVSMSGLVDKLEDLAVEYDRRRNKDEQAEQRAAFAGIAAALSGEADGPTPVKLKIGGGSATLETYCEIRRYAELKRVLGQGFQAHCIDNPLVTSMIGLEGCKAAPERLSKIEKRIYRSPNSAEVKARTVGRAKDRDASSRGSKAHVGHDD